MTTTAYPVRVNARLGSGLNRWRWLVKWLLVSAGVRRWVVLPMAAIAALALGLAPHVAMAQPATSVNHPVGSGAKRFTGFAFDTCTAPTIAQIGAWRASSYRGVGLYIGGINRTCAQPQLTANWVTAVSRQGWSIIPVYMGLQAPCTYRPNAAKIDPSHAASQGQSQAADAIAKARALGMRPGSAIYGDMEHYNPTSSACRATVLTYLSAWTREMHRQGFVSGVYAHLNSGALQLSQVYSSTAHARPDALWIARWDLDPSLSGGRRFPTCTGRMGSARSSMAVTTRRRGAGHGSTSTVTISTRPSRPSRSLTQSPARCR